MESNINEFSNNDFHSFDQLSELFGATDFTPELIDEIYARVQAIDVSISNLSQSIYQENVQNDTPTSLTERKVEKRRREDEENEVSKKSEKKIRLDNQNQKITNKEINDQQSDNYFNSLPDELMIYILSFLSPRDLTKGVNLTEKRWAILAHDPLLWKNLLIKVFPDSYQKYITQMINQNKNELNEIQEPNHKKIYSEFCKLWDCISQNKLKFDDFDFTGTDLFKTPIYIGKGLIKAACKDDKIRIINIKTKEMQTFPGLDQGLIRVMLPHEKGSVLGLDDGDICVLDTPNETETTLTKISIPTAPDRIYDLKIKGENFFTVAKFDGTIYECSLKNGEIINTFSNVDTSDIMNVFDVSNDYLVATNFDKIHIWDLKSNSAIRDIPTHQEWISKVQILGDMAITASHDGTLKKLNLKTGETLHTYKGHTKDVLDFKIYEGKMISSSYDHTLRIWDLENPEIPCLVLEEHSRKITSFDIIDNKIISVSKDYKLCVWDIETGHLLNKIQLEKNQNTSGYVNSYTEMQWPSLVKVVDDHIVIGFQNGTRILSCDLS